MGAQKKESLPLLGQNQGRLLWGGGLVGSNEKGNLNTRRCTCEWFIKAWNTLLGIKCLWFLPSPPHSYVEALVPNVTVLEGGLLGGNWVWRVREGVAPMKGSAPLEEEDTLELLHSAMWGHSKPGTGLSAKSRHAGPITLDFLPAFGTVRNKCLSRQSRVFRHKAQAD